MCGWSRIEWRVAVAAGMLAAAGTAFATVDRASAKIDKLVFAKLDELGIPASDPCTDEVFLRRVYLDMTGTLPSAVETRAFLSRNSANRRGELIEQLFEREEFSDYWALKWCDLLRVKAEFPSKLWPNAVQAYHRWVRTAVDENMPYDRFARELLTASGSNFRVPQVNFYRAMPNRTPESIASIVALTFMGMRTENWDRGQLEGVAAFFGGVAYKGTAEWKEEIVYSDPARQFMDPATGQPVQPVFPGGQLAAIRPGQDGRELFADWLVGSNVFAQNIVNRIWYWLMGRGLVHEPDDIRPDNPPQNQQLLDFLARELVESGFDLRHVYRIILNSRTYQLSSIHNEGNLSDQANFSHYHVRRLDAEVLIDAICQITGTTESYSSAIPEPFTFIPENQRSITLADGSITSPFLELFGRPPRDTGFESERSNDPSAAQKLHMLNSTHIVQKLSQNRSLMGMAVPDERRAKKGKEPPPASWLPLDEALDNLYLAILSRYPTPEERQVAVSHITATGSRWDATIDIIWALLNTKEFIYRH